MATQNSRGPAQVTAATARTTKQLAAGIVVDNLDQPGSIAYLDQVLTAGGVQTNFLVNGLDYTDFEAHDLSNLYQQRNSGSEGIKIVGSPLAAAGDPTHSGLSSNETVPRSPSDGSDTVEG